MPMRYWRGALWLAIALAGSGPLLAAGIAPELRVKAFGGLVPEVFSGEVVVKSDDHRVMISIDEADSDGRTDGLVDHLFLYTTVAPILSPLSLRDSDAEVEFRTTSLRILAHSEQSELQFLMNGVRPAPRPKQSAYSFQDFEVGVSLYHYSGEAAEGLWRDQLQEKEAEIAYPGDNEVDIIDPFQRDPDPGSGTSGGSCQSTCTKSCGGSSCSAACASPQCAKCSCIQSVHPSCYCA